MLYSFQIAVEWLTEVLAHLLVPALVWAFLISGLVWVVQDKIREDELAEVGGEDAFDGGLACLKSWYNT